jgi:putative hydrolase
LQRLADAGKLTDIQNVGEKTAVVIAEALRGETPQYLQDLLANTPEPGSEAGDALRKNRRDLRLQAP